MSNRRRPTRPTPTNTGEWLKSLVGRTVPGGCEDCNAEQTVTKTVIIPGFNHYKLQVFHDDGCPILVAHKRNGGEVL